MEKDRDISKLPKWMQARLKVAEMRIKECDERMQQLGGDSDTDTYFLVVMDEKPLPKGSRIRFKLAKGYVECYIRGDVVEVYTSDYMIVNPRASNVITVHGEQF